MACEKCNDIRKHMEHKQLPRHNSCKNFNMQRRIVQFNDIPIESRTSYSLTSGFKVETLPYTADHGSYYAHDGTIYHEEITLDLELEFPFGAVRRDQVGYYKNHLNKNMLKAGKMWFVQGGRLYWAWAIPTTWDEDFNGDRHRKILYRSFQFVFPEGVLYEADATRTFILDYNVCEFLEENSHDVGGVCTCNGFMDAPCVTCEECELLKAENTLCYLYANLDDTFASQCNNPHKIVYNCEYGKDMFGCEALWGDVYCACECQDYVQESFYSSTIINTSDVTIRLVGHFKDPEILLNNTKISIKGEYHGIIKIKNSTEFTYRPNCFDCECECDGDFCADPECYLWDYKEPMGVQCGADLQCDDPCVPEQLIDLDLVTFETCTGRLFEIVNDFNRLKVTGIMDGYDCSFVYIWHRRKAI